ncbi:MAG TPA: GTP cyclohydrolase I, partial [Acidobacteriaceae bacterium]|nr:GTP cyclohydrolase I [Acidobacteriaceae bacterium]
MSTKLPLESLTPERPGEPPAEVAARAVHVELAQATLPQIYAEILSRIGENPARDGLLRTPDRMEKAMSFLTRGYSQSLEEVIHGALFDVDYDEMVIVKDIEFYSLCEHHLLPFFGRAHVAYVPDG